jgi:hypothetical protein
LILDSFPISVGIVPDRPLPPSASFIKIDTPGRELGAGIERGAFGTMLEGGTGAPADGAMTTEVGETVCAFGTVKRGKDNTVTENGTVEGRTVGASVGIGATTSRGSNLSMK